MQGVLWDMDGVLVSTGDFHWQAWSMAFSERDIPFTQEQFQAIFGMNNVGILKLLLGETTDPELIAEIGDEKERLFRQVVRGHVRPLPGVLEWLERLDVWGIKQAIASSAPPPNIDALIDELGVRSYFAAIVSGDNLPGKPDPAVFLRAASQLHLPPQECVVVEDAIAGVAAAKRAGMKCVAVTTTHPAHRLQEADVVVERLDLLSPDEFKRLMF